MRLTLVGYDNIPRLNQVTYHTEKPSNFKNISFILGIGYGLCFNFLFKFINLLKKRTQFVLGLGNEEMGLPILNPLIFQVVPV